MLCVICLRNMLESMVNDEEESRAGNDDGEECSGFERTGGVTSTMCMIIEQSAYPPAFISPLSSLCDAMSTVPLPQSGKFIESIWDTSQKVVQNSQISVSYSQACSGINFLLSHNPDRRAKHRASAGLRCICINDWGNEVVAWRRHASQIRINSR